MFIFVYQLNNMKAINKKIQVIALVFVMLTTAVACHRGKSTTIISRTDNVSQKIQYSGKIVFTEDETGIEHISDGGYLEFTQNGEGFKAENNHRGKVQYEFDGNGKVNNLSDEQRQFVARAIKIIIKERAKLKPQH
jgi:hypothetical protein